MSDMMTFPDTWEEFEKSYGLTDNEEVYTNGARLIPSFRVKQWLDHLPSVQLELANNSKELENKNGELISRQAAIDIIFDLPKWSNSKGTWVDCRLVLSCLHNKEQLPSVHPDKGLILQKEQAYMQWYADGQKPQKGKWMPDENFGDDAYVCSFCQAIWHTGKIKNMEYCPSCGAYMRGEKNGE